MERPKLGFNEYDYLFKFVLVGAAGVGKTSLIMQYCERNYSMNYSATLGIDFRIRTIRVRDKIVKLQIWDTAGQERYSSISPTYFRGSHGCLVIFDLTEQATLETAVSYLQKSTSDYGIPEGCSLLVGNKSDLEEKRSVNREEALGKAKEYNAGYIETSAKTAAYVDEIFDSLAESLIDKCERGELNIEAGPRAKKEIISAGNIELKKHKNVKDADEIKIEGGVKAKCCAES